MKIRSIDSNEMGLFHEVTTDDGLTMIPDSMSIIMLPGSKYISIYFYVNNLPIGDILMKSSLRNSARRQLGIDVALWNRRLAPPNNRSIHISKEKIEEWKRRYSCNLSMQEYCELLDEIMEEIW